MVHGCIPCAWNSGRTLKDHAPLYIDQCIEAFQQREIPIFLTFSNYRIEEHHLLDAKANKLLDAVLASERNGVIVSSRILKEYIQSKYPRANLHSSILYLLDQNIQSDADGYLQTAQQFDRVVVHPDDCLDAIFLSCLHPRDRFEIIVNENCVSNCPHRKEHDDLICQCNLEPENDALFEYVSAYTKMNCRMLRDQRLLQSYFNAEIRNCNLSMLELNQIYAMGFKNFKLQGRADSPASFLYDLTRYLFSDYAAPLFFKLLASQISFSQAKERLELL